MTDAPIDPGKLWRLLASLQAVQAELRSVPRDSVTVGWLERVVEGLSGGTEDVLPVSLTAELRSLVTPVRAGTESERDLAVVLAALEGWLEGVMSQMIAVLQRGAGA